MQKTARWVIKEPNKPARVEEVAFSFENDDELSREGLKLAQALVQGYVECVPLGPGVTILCNEEAGLQPGKFKHNCGYLGTIVFVGDEENEEGELFWGSLNDAQVEKVMNWCRKYEGATYSPSKPQLISGQHNIAAYLDARRDAILNEWANL